jgi:hypothetical protein
LPFLLPNLSSNRSKTLKKQYASDPIFSSIFNSGWEKIDKYYREMDKTLVYVAAFVLSPGRKWKYVDKYWKAE